MLEFAGLHLRRSNRRIVAHFDLAELFEHVPMLFSGADDASVDTDCAVGLESGLNMVRSGDGEGHFLPTMRRTAMSVGDLSVSLFLCATHALVLVQRNGQIPLVSAVHVRVDVPSLQLGYSSPASSNGSRWPTG